MSLLTELWGLLSRRQRRDALLVMLSMVVGSLLETAGVALILPLVKAIQNPEDLQAKLGWFRSVLFRDSIASDTVAIIVGLFVLVFYVLKNVFLVVASYRQSRFVFRTQSSVSSRLLSAYLHAPWTFHLQRNPAELMRNITYDANVVFSNVVNPLAVCFTEGLITILVLALLVLVDPISSVTALVVLGGSTLLFYRLIRRKTDALGRERQKSVGHMIRWVNQSLGGTKEICVLGREEFFVNGYTSNSKQVAEGEAYLSVVSQAPRFYLEVLLAIGMLLAIWIAWIRAELGGSFLPRLALFAAATFRLMPAINRVAGTAANIRYHRPLVKTVASDLSALEHDIAALASDQDGAESPLSFSDRIELRDVCYQYAGASTDAISGISLTILKGASVAFEGPSGAGKTTLVDTILGLLKPSSGQVLVDGVDIQDDLRRWQRSIGYIPQMIYLPDASIRYNVAFGVPDDQINEGRVWAALQGAQLEDFVRALPQGLDMEVGERGARLSGGQRQRLGIARALYTDPAVLVLDEATASLDSETESGVTSAIQALRGRKTVVIISHRPSSIAECDARFQLRDGILEAVYFRNPPVLQAEAVL